MRREMIETGGQSLGSQLVRTDLSGCLMTDCVLCEWSWWFSHQERLYVQWDLQGV